MRFWLGTDRPTWLPRTTADLFLSHRVLGPMKKLPRASGEWALDSGGFSELSMFGRWETSETEYARAVARFQTEIGGLVWCAPQDWMVEPFMLAKTGLTIAEHQRRTIDSVGNLRARGLPVVPVLQGWERGDYLDHVEQYADAGLDLTAETLVGIGSVCRRSNTDAAVDILEEIAALGIALHGFGLKLTALRRASFALASADSMAWSYRARRGDIRNPAHGHRGRCSHCLDWALEWRDAALERAAVDQQPRLYVP